ncbi:Clavaminate synthase-like protein [Abortiporus biennis]|nr:Clavaminate synthase-like protein [Abortiporus biennis]
MSLPPIPHYTPAPPTQEELEYADLAIIDLSKASTAEGRAELAIQARDSVKEHGFLYVINHGWTQDQNKRIFDIADFTFSQVSDEEKKRYESKILETSTYRGYKPRQFWHIDAGVHDQIEHYNTNRDVNKQPHPEIIRPLLPEIDAFAKHNHFDILFPILRLLAAGMELPEDTFINKHRFDAAGETSVRFMNYPRSEEDEGKTNQVWLKGHTDIGSITILWSQPVSALQILSKDGKWRHIRHMDNALVINTGDALEFLSGGYYKPTIHRVIQPPKDQRGYTRVGAFYFVMPDDEVKLAPLVKESPVLQNVDNLNRFSQDASDVPTMEQWRKGRTKAYGTSQLKKVDGSNIEEEYINGVLVQHFN